MFELICFDCGDNPCLDYSEVSPRLQRIRGPRTMDTAWAAYEQHLGLVGANGRGWGLDARGPVDHSRCATGSERAAGILP